MERWREVVRACVRERGGEGLTVRTSHELLAAARAAFNDNPASFEIEEVLKALLGDSTPLYSKLHARCQEPWTKLAGELFDLLTEVLPDHSECMQRYMDRIVRLCVQAWPPGPVRRRALLCLAALSRCAGAGPALAPALPSLLAALGRADEPASHRGPLAALVGSIAEHYPELVTDHVAVWRSYLAVLEANKTTDVLASSVIVGVTGLFHKFGSQLPTVEVNAFAAKVLTSYSQSKNCRQAVLGLICKHATQFREVFCEERYRLLVYPRADGVRDPLVADALVAAYAAAAEAAAALNQQIANKMLEEIWRETKRYPDAPSLGLRCAWAVADRCRPILDPAAVERLLRKTASFVSAIEHELECKVESVSDLGEQVWYDSETVKLLEKAQWWLRRGERGSEIVLRRVVRLQALCPGARRRQLVAHPVLSSHCSSGIISFLVSESCRPTYSSESGSRVHLPLWRELFDSRGGTDQLVIDNARRVLKELVSCVLSVARSSLASDTRDASQLDTLFLLASEILSWECVEGFLQDSAEVLLSTFLDCVETLGVSEGGIALVATLVEVSDAQGLFEDGTLSGGVVERSRHFYECLRLSRFGDETVLLRSSRALVCAPAHIRTRAGEVKDALHTILTRRDADAALQGRALACLQEIVEGGCADREWFVEMKHRLEELWRNDSRTGKDARILRRDISMFLGKYGSGADTYEEETFDGNAPLKRDALSVNLPGPLESCKLDLAGVYEAALHFEDSEALWAALLMLCSSASNEPVQFARVAHGLARCYSRGELEPARVSLVEAAAPLCAGSAWEAALELVLERVYKERSPGARAALCSVLGALVRYDAHSGPTQQLLSLVTESAKRALSSSNSIKRRAGLDVTEAIVMSLRQNDTLSKEQIPILTSLVLQSKEPGFETCFDLLVSYIEEKLIIFESDTLEALAKSAVENVTLADAKDAAAFRIMLEKSVHLTKLLKKTVLWTDISTGTKDVDRLAIVLYALVQAKVTLEWDFEFCRSVLYSKSVCLNTMTDCLKNDTLTEFLVEAMLSFLGEYADCLMEFQYEKTSKLLASILTALSSPVFTKYRYKMVKCFNKYHAIWSGNIPGCIEENYRLWFDALPLKEISDKLRFRHPDHKHRIIANYLKLTLSLLNSDIQLENADIIRQWPKTIVSVFEASTLSMDRTKMEYLTDCLTVSFYFIGTADVIECLRNLKFYQDFVAAFGSYFLRHLKALLHEKLTPILDDVMKEFLKFAVTENLSEKKRLEIIDIVDKLWTSMSTKPIHSLHAILGELCLLKLRPMKPDANAAQWLLAELGRTDTSADRALLMEMLPAVHLDNMNNHILLSALKCYCDSLPRLASELSSGKGARCFRAALAALSSTGDVRLLRMMISVAVGDDPPGWWENAICSCARSLAGNGQVADALCERALTGESPPAARLHLLERMLVPLLQWSSTWFCEDFFSSRLDRMFSSLSSVPSDLQKSTGSHLDKYLMDYIVALTLARVMFEKLPESSLERSESALYTRVRNNKMDGRPWWAVRRVCMLAVALRNKMAAATRTQLTRLFHCANYNCLVAAITKRGLFKMYAQLFVPEIWPLIIDCDKKITRWGPLDQRNSNARKRRDVSVACSTDGVSAWGLASTSPTNLFLATLSDNPLRYDLLPSAAEPPRRQSVVLPASELNANECAATLSALLRHVAADAPAADAAAWVGAVAAVVEAEAEYNVRATLAQVMCNCSEQLKRHASLLRAPLLSVMVERPADNRRINGLDVAILDTVSLWTGDVALDEKESALMSRCLKLLLLFVCEPHSSDYAPKLILSKVETLSKLVGTGIVLEWDDLWKTTVIDTDYNEFAIRAWQAMSRHFRVPNLTSLAIAALDLEQPKSVTSKMAELFGLAISKASEDEKRVSLVQFRQTLKTALSKDKTLFVELAHYVRVCDVESFRIIKGLTNQMPDRLKTKCFRVMSTYLSTVRAPSEDTSDVFHIVNVSEMLLGGDRVKHGLMLAKNGLRVMDGSLHRRVVSQALEHCLCSDEDVRALAYELLIASVEDELKVEQNDPTDRPAKRLRTDVPHSPLLALIRSDRDSSRRMLAQFGRGLTDGRERIRNLMQSAFGKMLDDSLTIRFLECLAVLVVLPSCEGPYGDRSVSRLSVCAGLTVGGARSSVAFKQTLNNEALKKSIESATVHSTKLLTSDKYQGSLTTGPSGAKAPWELKTKESVKCDLNVEISCDDLLKAFLDFSKVNTDAARLLFTAICRPLLGSQPVRQSVAAVVESVPCCEDTPALIELALQCAEEVASVTKFVRSVEELSASTRGTTGERLVTLLREELTLQGDCEHLLQWNHGEDVEMLDTKEFSISGLLEAVERMSDWDDLTESQRTALNATPLFTSDVDLQQKLGQYFDAVDSTTRDRHAWLVRLYAVYSGGDVSNEWLSDVRKWPINAFGAYATAEAVEWHEALSGTRRYDDLVRRPLVYDTCNMAQSATLLMFRSVLCRLVQSRKEGEPSDSDVAARGLRLQEALWARNAAVRGATTAALSCLERNVRNLYKSEILSWRLVQLQCLLNSPLQDDIEGLLRESEQSVKNYEAYSDPELILEYQELMARAAAIGQNWNTHGWRLDQLTIICDSMRRRVRGEAVGASGRGAAALLSAHRTAAAFCDAAVDTCHDADTRERLLDALTEFTLTAADIDTTSTWSMDVALLLRHLVAADRATVKKGLDKLSEKAGRLDPLALDVIRRMKEGAWSDIGWPPSLSSVLADTHRAAWRRNLETLRDPAYLLRQLCEQIDYALLQKDGAKLTALMNEMAHDSCCAGLAYCSLETQRAALKSVAHVDLTSKSSIDSTRKHVAVIMRQIATTRDSIPLADVCPALASYPDGASERDREYVDSLMGVGRGVSVVKFDPQLMVMTGSLRRPVLVKVHLSDGHSRRYLVKCGEDLRRDEACQRAQGYFNVVLASNNLSVRTYKVTPLSASSGLIEFLDDFVTVRSLISKTVNIEQRRAGCVRPPDADLWQLALPHSAALRVAAHRQALATVPRRALRSAMQAECRSPEQFIAVKCKFLDSLAAMTVSHWLLGVGDRHLENLIVSRAGALCGVDWGCALDARAARLPPEPQPARLTSVLRAVNALADTVLESRMQRVLHAVRDKWRHLYSACHLVFHWDPDYDTRSFQNKLERLKCKMCGAASSFQTSLEAMSECTAAEMQPLCELVRSVGVRYVEGRLFSVAEQISALLEHCTNEDLLAVTRSGWEPWL